jgi:hypothetical protein
MTKELKCAACDRTDHEVPLILLEFKGEAYAICPQHLPLLIHSPAKLAGKLPGVENLSDLPEH